MSLTTPSKIRELQIKLYRKAKNEPGYRFYQLYDKVYREDILRHAYALARENDGAPGVDGVTFREIESAGLAKWLKGLREELRDNVLHFLRRRHKVSTRGTQRFSHARIFDELGVIRLRTLHLRGSRRQPPRESSRRAGCSKSARPVR